MVPTRPASCSSGSASCGWARTRTAGPCRRRRSNSPRRGGGTSRRRRRSSCPTTRTRTDYAPFGALSPRPRDLARRPAGDAVGLGAGVLVRGRIALGPAQRVVRVGRGARTALVPGGAVPEIPERAELAPARHRAGVAALPPRAPRRGGGPARERGAGAAGLGLGRA